MMIGGFRVGEWFGFRIRVDYSWFIVFALVVWTFAAGEFPGRLPGLSSAAYTTMGVVGALLLFLSVLLHELAHSVVARSRGIPVEGITLFIFGGVAEMRMEARRPVDEFLLTIVGPLSSMGLAVLFLVVARLCAALGQPPAAAVAGTLSVLNLVLAVFNLVPAFPLDGGRILRSIIWRLSGDLGLATRWATLVGRGFGWLLIAAGFFLFINGYGLSGLWGILLGWFLTAAATTAARQDRVRRALSGVSVARVMQPGARVVPAATTAAQLSEHYFLRSTLSAYAVASGGRVIGLVSLRDLSRLSSEEQQTTPISEVMQPLETVQAVDPDDPVLDVVTGLRSANEDRAIVVRNGELRGILTLHDVAAWIERARELHFEAAEGKHG